MQVNPRPDINSLLTEMRALRMQAQEGALANQIKMDPVGTDNIAADKVAGAAKVEQAGFGDLLREAVGAVNGAQLEAGRMTNAFVRGEQDNLVATMVAVQKANVAFQGATQIRNRLVSAYEDIMNMPI